MNRVAIFAHFDKRNKIEDYVIYYLKELKKVVKDIIFVSDSNISNKELEKISKIVTHKIAEKHGEYDFGSYKKGYFYLLENNLINNYDELIFANDSCFGPLYSFEELFEKMNEKSCDFWGTNENKFEYAPHIQSFFMVFRKQVFMSEVFKNFISKIKKEENKELTIIHYEVGLSKILIDNKFKFSSMYKTPICRKFSDKNNEVFLKKSILNHHNPYLVRLILNRLHLKNYPIFLIEKHAKNTGNATFKTTINTLKIWLKFLLNLNFAQENAIGTIDLNPKFSIITASYNYENYIKETIESVLAQTYNNWEMIIVDDGSKDNSIKVIKEYCLKDSRIKLLTHENNENKGLVETVKLGIKNSANEWIVFLESDDTITPNYLEKKLSIIKENPEVKFIFNDVNLFGNKERIRVYDDYFIKVKKNLSENPYPNKQLKCFKHDNMVSTFSAVACKKELFDKIDYNSPINALLDYYLWMQIAQKTSLYYIDEKLTNWRMHNSYITKKNINPVNFRLFEYKKKLLINPKLKFLSPLFYGYFMALKLRKATIKIHAKERQIILFGKEFNY